MGYTADEILEKVEEHLEPENVAQFYAQDFVNYRGTTSDTGQKYTDVIASHLFLPHISKMLEQIQTIDRKSPYHGNRPMIESDPDALPTEEHIARSMKGKTYDYIGKIIDYQTPLKDKQSDKAGKIDLLSYNEETKCAYILELKRADSKETLLRCALEAYTYRRMVNEKKLLNDFDLPADTELFAAVLVYHDSQQYKDFYDGDWRDFTCLILKVDFFVLDKDGMSVVEAAQRVARIEEQAALGMMGKTYTCIGKIIDYHVLIQNELTNKLRKIDLLSYDEASKCLYILKYNKRNDKTPLIDCLIDEIRVNDKKLLNDYNLPADTELFTGVLVYHGSQAHQDFCNNKTYYMDLMGKMKKDLLVLDKDGTDVMEAFLSWDGVFLDSLSKHNEQQK